MAKCFACDRKSPHAYRVVTSDGQVVPIGSECRKLVRLAGAEGYQPPKGGPRLYLATFNPDGSVKTSLRPGF